ncbi:unnamed protein product [Protopolystoma xenopodis]|uniref:Uncharacterized protein n=1 Tax=Protopolystoma xenopodis TaxID=117903 RepID=A0A3S5B7T9_9PLAT|nr:unnamed protein product [Protopolystoma xenopodis]
MLVFKNVSVWFLYFTLIRLLFTHILRQERELVAQLSSERNSSASATTNRRSGNGTTTAATVKARRDFEKHVNTLTEDRDQWRTEADLMARIIRRWGIQEHSPVNKVNATTEANLYDSPSQLEVSGSTIFLIIFDHGEMLEYLSFRLKSRLTESSAGIHRGRRAVRRLPICTNLQSQLQVNPTTASGEANSRIPSTRLFKPNER